MLTATKRSIRILHLEDNPRDAELIRRGLESAGLACAVVRADGQAAFESALTEGRFDLVLCDFNVPGYDALSALKRARELDTNLPFVVISGELSEEEAVECLRAGATDYLLKHRLQRLAPAVVRALDEAVERKQRHQAEIARQESEDRFRLMVEHVVDYAIVALDIEGRVLTWNAGAERAQGYQAEEIIGQHISRFYTPEDAAAGKPDKLLQQARSEGHAADEGWRVRKDGSQFLANVVITAVRDEDGQLRGFSKVTRDITERRQMEQRLRQSEKMEAIGQLTGGVAHDFNNLLGIVIGNLDLLERALSDNENALKRVQTAQRAALRGADLTRRLLAFSRRQQLEVQPVSLRETVDNLVGMAVRTLGPEIRITTQVAENLAPVLADAAGLENALLNLAINSRDAMPRGGELTFAARPVVLDANYPPVRAGEINAGCYACISVSDTGQGIPPDILEKAFEPFFTTKEKGKGTGLGLAMVYGLVKQLRGHVNIYSEVGHGTTVRLYLPFANGIAAASSISAAQQSPAQFTGTVLVVDDEVDLLEVAVAYLEDMGWTVLCAPDGLAAMEIVARRPGIDLLLTDVVMPGGMNGMELAQKASDATPGLKVIYSTGFSSVALAQRSGLIVSGKVLSKPYRREEFVAAVHEVMAQGGG